MVLGRIVAAQMDETGRVALRGHPQPVVMNWPARIKDKGGLRSQFHHIIDIAPTILEAAGIPEPRSVNSVAQRPIEGVSMAYTWDDAKAEGRRVTQYFEMMGNRALYHDGWVAACRHGKLPWQTSGSFTFDDDVWELYHIDEDFSEFHDLAARKPKKLRELQDLFMAEAAKYNVLPLDDRFAERADVRTKPNYLRGKTRFTYLPGTVRIPETGSPPTKNVHHTIAASVEIKDGDEGVLACCGGEFRRLYGLHQGRAAALGAQLVQRGPLPCLVEGQDPGRQAYSSAEIIVDKENAIGGGGKVTLRMGEKVIGEGQLRSRSHSASRCRRASTSAATR